MAYLVTNSAISNVEINGEQIQTMLFPFTKLSTKSQQNNVGKNNLLGCGKSKVVTERKRGSDNETGRNARREVEETRGL